MLPSAYSIRFSDSPLKAVGCFRFLLVLLAGMVSIGFGQGTEDYLDFSAAGLPGRLYVPPLAEAPGASERPLILALHGGGGIGDDNADNVFQFGPLLEVAKRRQAFLYVPQATTAYWDTGDRPERIMAKVDQLIETHAVDSNRLYIIGYSMGGGGTWDMYSRYADRFAAAVPICSVTPGRGYDAARLINKPAWTFHARNDIVVTVGSTHFILNGLIAAAGLPPIEYPPSTIQADWGIAWPEWELYYTEWSSGGHGIWHRVFQSEEAMDWMFSHSLVDAPLGPVIRVHPQSITSADSEIVELSVQSIGTGELSYQWIRDGEDLPGEIAPTLRLTKHGSGSTGLHRVRVTDDEGATLSQPAQVLFTEQRSGGLVNLSIRGRANSESRPVIVGFSTEGAESPFLLRGIGPTLSLFGVSGAAAKSMIRLYRSTSNGHEVEAENRAWGGGEEWAQRFAKVGAFSLPDAESADAVLYRSLTGPHTIHVSGTGEEAGVVLAEVYDVNPGEGHRLRNLSARGMVGVGDDALIAGFVINGNVPRRILVRAVGPGLTNFGVAGALDDPFLELFADTDGTVTSWATNDDWGSASEVEDAMQITEAFPLDFGSKDALLMLTLPGGVYTAKVTGAGDSSGEALVEIYDPF